MMYILHSLQLQPCMVGVFACIKFIKNCWKQNVGTWHKIAYIVWICNWCL